MLDESLIRFADRRGFYAWVQGAVVVWLLSLLPGTDARAAQAHGYALDCAFSNGNGSPWVSVTPLNTQTPVGSVLWQRWISLVTDYRVGRNANSPHELVSVGGWSGGTAIREGIAPTNVPGIGFRIEVNSSDGHRRTIIQSPRLMAFEKDEVLYEVGAIESPRASIMTTYIQSLILTVPPDQLPKGNLLVERVDGSSTLQLYALDLPKGEASLGAEVASPGGSEPIGICRHGYPLMGSGLINMGDGGPIEIPNTCVVEGYKSIPVRLGRFALADFPKVNDTSPQVPFSIELSQCALNARPRISFTDKSGASLIPGVLGLSSSSRTAKGFGIVMVNDLTQLPIQYNGASYEMQRIGDGAKIPLRASYIRTGHDGEIEAGRADGAAEFTFTFP